MICGFRVGLFLALACCAVWEIQGVVLAKPDKERSRALVKLRAEVAAIRARAKAEATLREHDLKVLKYGFEKKLEAKQAENAKILHSVKRLRASVAELKGTNAMKRALAKKIRASMTEDVATADKIEANLTIAAEGILTASAAFKTRLQGSNVTQLSVLAELDARDAAARQEQEHVRSLARVASSRPAPSLLQMESELSPAAAEKLLASLTKSMNDLAQEGNNTAAQVKDEFEVALQEGQEKHDSLVKTEEELAAAESHEKEIGKRLDEAIRHLKETRDFVRARNKGLRQFLRKSAADDNADALVNAPTARTAKKRNAGAATKAPVYPLFVKKSLFVKKFNKGGRNHHAVHHHTAHAGHHHNATKLQRHRRHAAQLHNATTSGARAGKAAVKMQAPQIRRNSSTHK